MYLCKFATGEETESRKILETNILKTLPKPGPIPARNINRFFMSKNKRRPQPQPQPILEPEKQTGEENLAPQPPVPKEENKKNGPEQDSVSRPAPDLPLSQRIAGIMAGLPTRKAKRIGGFLCLAVGLLLVISFLSHFFFWWIDYDVVQQMQKGSIWSDYGWNVRNLGGRLGAYVAYAFINQGFGIASFFFPVLLILGGLDILCLRHFRWKRILLQSAFCILWISILLGSCFQQGSNYIFGGSAGLHTSRYLQGLIGKAGLFILLVFLLASYLVANYNFLKFKRKNKPVRYRRQESIVPGPVPDESPADPEPGPQADAMRPANLSANEYEEEDDDLGEITLTTRIRETDTDSRPQNKPDGRFQSQPASPQTKPVPTTPIPSTTRELTISHVLSESLHEPEEPAPETGSGQNDEDDGMEIIDLRLNQEPVARPGNPVVRQGDHLGIDTQFDPRLELSDFRFPTIDLLEDFGDQSQKLQDMEEELVANKNRIVETLLNYGINISKISATIGPTVTLYEIVPAPGVKISKIKNLEDDIALSLSALGIRIIAPIPGKGTIGIEVPNRQKQVVPMRDMLTSEKFIHNDMALPIALGKTISNEVYITDLAKMPHLLVAGATGQGKSVGLNAIIASLLYSKHPAELKFVMVDPKKVELSLFNKIERHYLAKLPDSEEAVITDTRKVVRTLNSLCIEMDNRYQLLKDAGTRNLKEYNKKFISRRLNPEEGHHFLPYIVLIIDEFADLIMTAGKEVELPIARLAQLARAVGIHLVIATQRPSVNVITGLIKANFPARIAFKVSQKIDSRTILDAGGADQLIGRGDMLISAGEGLIRLQCAFIDTPEIERITEFIGAQRGYPTAFMLPECPDENGEGGKGMDMDADDWDPLFKEAAELVVGSQQGSTSMLQRKFKLGYNRAGRIMDQLENAGVVGAFDGKKTREVKIKDQASLEVIFKTLSL